MLFGDSACGCCCIPILQESGAVGAINGASVSFNAGAGTYAELEFAGVNGFWLGRQEDGFEGYTQSVTITFSGVRPYKAVVRCSGLDEGQDPERFNYAFSGASTVAFAMESGEGITDNGATVFPGTVPGVFRLTAEGDISSIFLEGEMIDGGSNGVIVSVCVFVHNHQ